MTYSGQALTEYAHGRTDQIREKLRDAMKKIEYEIEQNSGIYPFNGGRLSLSEVCRRAGVHKVTLQGASHRASSKPLVELWIKNIGDKLITGSKTVRKNVAARANDWESQYRAIANKFNEMYAIDVIATNKSLKLASARIETLEQENLRLRLELSNGKVVQLPKPKR